MSDILSDKEIFDCLSKVVDPDLGITLGELNAIGDIQKNGDIYTIYLELIQPIDWVAEDIRRLCNDALKDFPELNQEIIINEKIMPTPKRTILKGVKNIIAVASGKGGVGKSSMAANIAAALSLDGAKVGILDGDVYGPSQPTMFGLQNQPLMAEKSDDGNTIVFPNEKYGIKVASMGFVMNRDEAAIVRGPLLAGYFSMLFEQIEWGELDFMIFDLPPGTGDIQLTLTQKIPLTGAVIVTTPQEIAVADVRRSIAMFKRVNVDILGIVENMSYFVPPDLPEKKYYIFGEGGGKNVAKANNIPFLGEVPLDMNMREGNDNGMPIVLDHDSGLQGRTLIEITQQMVSEVRRHNYNTYSAPGLDISI